MGEKTKTINSMIGKDFENISQRIVYSYIFSFPPFQPIKSELADEKSQKEMYAFLKDVKDNLFSEPSLLKLSKKADAAITEDLLKDQKELNNQLKRIVRKLQSFYLDMYKIGLKAKLTDTGFAIDRNEIKIKRKHLTALKKLDIISRKKDNTIFFQSSKYPDIFPAWKLLAKTIQDNYEKKANIVFHFSRGLFSLNKDYLIDSFILLDPKNAEFIKEMNTYLRDRGYQLQYDIGSYDVGVQYIKDEALRFNLQYKYRRYNQILYYLRLTHIRDFWKKIDSLSKEGQQFLFKVTKQCDECGFCDNFKGIEPFLQTFNDEEYSLCPWYPKTRWHQLTEQIIQGSKELLELQQQI